MTLETGATVSGEIVDIRPEGVIVSLPEGQSGLVAACESLPSETLKDRFHTGERVTVRIVEKEEDGRFNLAILPPQEGRSVDRFDRDFHRLNHVLSRRPTKLTSEQVRRNPMSEERIKEWISQAEQAIGHLHRHRAKRLSETFHDDKSEGGPHAKRNRHHR